MSDVGRAFMHAYFADIGCISWHSCVLGRVREVVRLLCLFKLPITNAYPSDATCVIRSGSGGVARVIRERGGVARGGEPCLWSCNTIGR
jgi:hypothetical protein